MINREKVLDKKVIHRISKRIVENFDPEKIILFGSYSQKTHTKNSDVDILVIMDSKQSPVKRNMEVSKVCRPKFVSMDILVRTPKEIKKRLEIGDYFIKEIIKKGKVLYARKAG